MDLIKKHWGILLCTVIFLGALVFLLMKTYQLSQEYGQSQKAIDEQRNWFAGVNKDGWRIVKGANGELENAVLAEQNKYITVGHYNEIRRDLYNRFVIEPELPPNSDRAAEMLDRKLSQLTELALATYKMNFGDVIGGRLAEINQDGEMLMEQDFKPVFRQLMIYEEIIRLLGSAGIKDIEMLDFPRSLQVEEADGYTITPIVLSFTATVDKTQRLINSMTNDRHMLFFTRNISFTNVNEEQPAQEYTQIALMRRQMLDTKKEQKLNGRATTGEMGMGGGMGTSSSKVSSRRSSRKSGAEMMGGSEKSSRRSSSRRSKESGGMADMGGGRTGGMGNGMDNFQSLLNIDEAYLAYEEPKRQDNFVFRSPKTIAVELTLDLIEMTNLDEDEEPSSEAEEEEEPLEE